MFKKKLKPMGGTELIAARVEEVLDGISYRDRFNIIHSRYGGEPLPRDKKNILVCHDLAQDPMYNHLSNEGWKKFDHFVFVSNWQQSMFNAYRGIPYDAGTVIENSIVPIGAHIKPDDGPLNLIYTSTPHRGLDILQAAFKSLSERHDIRLKVFSSFEIYGAPKMNEPFEPLYEALRNTPKITYSKSVSNDQIRNELRNSHIFCLPSTWQETSCLSLIEAMSAGCACVHSNLAALPETAKGLTHMYPYTENKEKHLKRFTNELEAVITEYHRTSHETDLIDYWHDMSTFERKWNRLVERFI